MLRLKDWTWANCLCAMLRLIQLCKNAVFCFYIENYILKIIIKAFFLSTVAPQLSGLHVTGTTLSKPSYPQILVKRCKHTLSLLIWVTWLSELIILLPYDSKNGCCTSRITVVWVCRWCSDTSEVDFCRADTEKRTGWKNSIRISAYHWYGCPLQMNAESG